MAKRKSKKKKQTKKKVQKKSKERSQLEKLKEKQNELYKRVEENNEIVLRCTGIEREEFNEIIDKYGYENLSTVEGFDIIRPIWDQMVELYKVYTDLSEHVERLKVLESKVLIHDSKKLVEEMETKIQELDKEDSYYTELPDAEGIVKMKKKWYIEKEFWENRKEKFETYLNDEENFKQLTDADKEKMQLHLEEAKEKLKQLNKKRNWAKRKNIQPSITKYSKKVSSVINSVQDSISEVTKPFAEAGKMAGGSNEKLPNYEKMFSDSGDANIGKQYENFFTDKKKNKGSKSDWENYFG